MSTLRDAAEEFLSHRRIAVAGVSRDPEQPANIIFRRLRDSGHEVYAINPNIDTVEDAPCYASVTALPVRVDGVVIVTAPEVAPAIVEDCAVAGIARVWLHRGMGRGSSSEEAVEIARERGIAVIPGGCPNMFGATSDVGHRCMRTCLSACHRIPREFPYLDVKASAGVS
jgi:predicted CoA-binding protein